MGTSEAAPLLLIFNVFDMNIGFLATVNLDAANDGQNLKVNEYLLFLSYTLNW